VQLPHLHVVEPDQQAQQRTFARAAAAHNGAALPGRHAQGHPAQHLALGRVPKAHVLQVHREPAHAIGRPAPQHASLGTGFPGCAIAGKQVAQPVRLTSQTWTLPAPPGRRGAGRPLERGRPTRRPPAARACRPAGWAASSRCRRRPAGAAGLLRSGAGRAGGTCLP